MRPERAKGRGEHSATVAVRAHAAARTANPRVRQRACTPARHMNRHRPPPLRTDLNERGTRLHVRVCSVRAERADGDQRVPPTAPHDDAVGANTRPRKKDHGGCGVGSTRADGHGGVPSLAAGGATARGTNGGSGRDGGTAGRREGDTAGDGLRSAHEFLPDVGREDLPPV